MTAAAVFGAAGRMGKLIVSEAAGRLEVIQTIDTGSRMKLDPAVEVVIDFSLSDAWRDLNSLLADSSVPLVSGTTGLGEQEIELMKHWASNRPVFYSSNMSVGIHVLGKLMDVSSKLLDDSFDRELVEFHHRRKKDSPSGTALSLLDHWNNTRVFGRDGDSGERKPGTVGVHCVRGGDVVGEHHLHFMGDGERLTISHVATDRKVFALGALRAANFVIGKPPGLYSMEDMLG